MYNQDVVCPMDGCSRNSGGICCGRGPVIAAYATNAMNMGMASGFLAPFTPAAIAMTPTDPTAACEGEMYRNCSYYRQHDLRK